MSRPAKGRRVCCMPSVRGFSPFSGEAEGTENAVIMAVDEYETVRLIDLAGCTQEECARQMQVARTTVQAIYDRARNKLAEALVMGRTLVVGGGPYRICPHGETCEFAGRAEGRACACPHLANGCCGKCGKSCEKSAL